MSNCVPGIKTASVVALAAPGAQFRNAYARGLGTGFAAHAKAQRQNSSSHLGIIPNLQDVDLVIRKIKAAIIFGVQRLLSPALGLYVSLRRMTICC